ncbi:MAG: hypothetical protein K8H85_09080 [Cyclobacteriaceae bacterium]|nr:hypothetical protein [Cyclobacteriaceae bacterium]
MTVIIIIILIIIFLGAIGTPNTRKTQRIRGANMNQKTSYPPAPTVSDLVKNVNTIEDFKEFERQQKQVYEKFSEDFDNKYYNKLYDRYESAYAKVSDKISDKVFHYQFTPELELETPLKHLNLAYRLLSPEEYSQNKRGTDNHEWNEVTGNDLLIGELSDYIKERPTQIDSLLKYREIFESKLLFEEKVTAITSLIKRDDDFRDMYFDGVINFDTRCRVLLFADSKIPGIELLVNNGFNTPNKIKRVTREQLKTIKGFSEKRIDKLFQTIARLK